MSFEIKYSFFLSVTQNSNYTYDWIGATKNCMNCRHPCRSVHFVLICWNLDLALTKTRGDCCCGQKSLELFGAVNSTSQIMTFWLGRFVCWKTETMGFSFLAWRLLKQWLRAPVFELPHNIGGFWKLVLTGRRAINQPRIYDPLRLISSKFLECALYDSFFLMLNPILFRNFTMLWFGKYWLKGKSRHAYQHSSLDKICASLNRKLFVDEHARYPQGIYYGCGQLFVCPTL